MRSLSCLLLGGIAAVTLAACGTQGISPQDAASATQTDSGRANSRTLSDLYNFCSEYPSCSDGGGPSGTVALDATGAIYGTLSFGGVGHTCGGKYACGAVFKLTPSGSRYAESLPYSFCQQIACRDGAAPAGALAFDAQGRIFGTTTAGGFNNQGTVFELTPSGSGYAESVVYSFCQVLRCGDGKTPLAGVIVDGKGALYGTTNSGGRKNGGVVFKLTPSGSGYVESGLYDFCQSSKCADGKAPSAGVVFDAKGALYGTTVNGGANAAGTVFRLTPSGAGYTESVLYSFCAKSKCRDGAHPQASVTFGRHGALYGTTTAGGFERCPHYQYGDWRGCGVVFRLTPSGSGFTETVLHSFCRNLYACTGALPSGVVFDKKGALYGTTSYGGRYFQQGAGGGIIFKLSPSGSSYRYRVVYYFGLTNSFHPNTTPVFGDDDALFGTSTGIIPIMGPNQGTVWELHPAQ